MSGSADRHNRLAPDIMRQIVTGTDGESEAMVVLESVLFGMMLYYRPKPRQAAEFLDSITARVIDRMGA